MNRWLNFLIVLLMFVLLMMVGCTPTTPVLPIATPVESPDETMVPTDESEPTLEETPEPLPQPTNTWIWSADGIVGEDEYQQTLDLNGVRLWWYNDAEFLYVAIEGDTQGWVSLGLNPQERMMGADYIFGYVENGEVKVWDAYGTAPAGATHPPDTDLGGTDNLISYAGMESEGLTFLEVQIPLNSGDAYDTVLEVGNSYPVIVAMGAQDDFNAKHTMYASAEITLRVP